MGPLITTMALGLTIPLSMIVSSFSEDVNFTWMYYFGSFLILLAFLALSIFDYKKMKLEKRKEEEEKMRLEMEKEN
jgi:hypothetical protein